MGNQISEAVLQEGLSVFPGEDAVQYFDNFQDNGSAVSEKHFKDINDNQRKPSVKANYSSDDYNYHNNSCDILSKQIPAKAIIKDHSNSQIYSKYETPLKKELLVDIVYAIIPHNERTRSDRYENGNYLGSKELEDKLKSLFNVDDDEIIDAIECANKKKPQDKSVEIGILEARKLKAKIQKDSSNPFCIARIIANSAALTHSDHDCSSDTWKTEVAYDTVNPRWNSWFKLGDSLTDDIKIIFEVWHFNPDNVLHLLNEKIPFGLPKALKRDAQILLGSATVDLKLSKIEEFDTWIKLGKPKEDDGSSGAETKCKRRGEVHFKIKTEVFKNQISFAEKRNFRDMLASIAYQYECNYKQLKIPWNGSISNTEKKIIDSYCATFSMSALDLSCAWWLVLSSADLCCDYKYLLSVATDVLRCFNETNSEMDKEMRELEDSVIYWINLQIIKLKDLGTFFPSDTSCSKDQLSYCLRILSFLEEKLSPRLLKKTLHPYNLCISEALQDYVKSWWNKEQETSKTKVQLFKNDTRIARGKKARTNGRINNKMNTKTIGGKDVTTLSDFRATHLNLYRSLRGDHSSETKILNLRNEKFNVRNSTTYQSLLGFPKGRKRISRQRGKILEDKVDANSDGNEQASLEGDIVALKEAAYFVEGVYHFLTDIASTYDRIFYKHYRIPFFRQAFTFLSNEVAVLLRPLLSKLYNTYAEVEDLAPKANPLALERGTPVYQLYFMIRKIETLCKDYEFSSEIQLHSGFRGHWRWFSSGMKLWLRRTFLRTKNRIAAEVADDDLKVSREDCKCSFSAMSAVEVHKMILSGWRVLQWPEEDTETEWLHLIGDVLCSLGILYAKEIKHKISAINLNSEDTDREWQLQICHAVNNFTMVNDALHDLPQLLKDSTGYSCDFSISREEYPSSTEMNKLQKLVDDRRLEIDCMADAILDCIVNTLSRSITKTTEDSCKLGDDGLVTELLKCEIFFHRTHLLERNFQVFLSSTWIAMLRMYRVLIEANKIREKFGFFQCLFRCFENAIDVLRSQDTNLQFHLFEDYDHVRGLLSHLQLTTEALISSYYFERYQEQEDLGSDIKSFGDVAVRGSISWTGTLNLEVIMARNLEVLPLTSSNRKHLFWRQEQKQSKMSPDTYVIARIIPSSSFRGVPSLKSKIQKKSLDPVFNSSFEFSLGDEKSRLECGLVQLLIYKRDYCISDSLIGEALLPLNCVTRIPIRIAEMSRERECLFSSTGASATPRAKNVFLRITKPKKLDVYDAVKFLELRKGDKTAECFLKEIKKI